ncbi:uncharacterized protein LOC144071558 [Stigmatopora argus]
MGRLKKRFWHASDLTHRASRARPDKTSPCEVRTGTMWATPGEEGATKVEDGEQRTFGLSVERRFSKFLKEHTLWGNMTNVATTVKKEQLVDAIFVSMADAGQEL